MELLDYIQPTTLSDTEVGERIGYNLESGYYICQCKKTGLFGITFDGNCTEYKRCRLKHMTEKQLIEVLDYLD